MAKLPLPISFKRLYLPTAMEGSDGAGRVMTGEVDLPAMAKSEREGEQRESGRGRLLIRPRGAAAGPEKAVGYAD
jgi:hypothetical protein